MFDLDTNTVAYFFKGVGRVNDRLFATPRETIYVSTVVVYDLAVGVAKSPESRRRREQLHTFLAAVTIVPFGAREAEVAANVRAALEARGVPIGQLDALIAATALARGSTLVTHNTREFSRIEGLRVEDWFS